MRKRYIPNPRLIVITTIAILIISVIAFIISKNFTFVSISDKIFTVSIIAGIIGTTIAIISNSKIHYYLYIKKKNKGDLKAENEYYEGEARRDNYSILGISMALGIIIPIICSAILTIF